MMQRRLGAAQLSEVRGDVARNTEQHLKLIALAAPARLELLIFPELSLTLA